MPLNFEGDAICLSGSTGSKLKCEIIAEYYPFWWGITSGGAKRNYQYKTAIIELNAATGEIFLEDTKEVILGSAGHVMDLKVSNPTTNNLKVVLVEPDLNCYQHLKSVISRRWNSVNIGQAEVMGNPSNILLLNQDIDAVLNTLEKLNLTNTRSLFYFDPLRMIDYQAIEKVAKRLIRNFKIGTEFIIFMFTSDWFLGRKEFVPLPLTATESDWTAAEKETVQSVDSLFGDETWRKKILDNLPIEKREQYFVEEYKNRLHRWFRYVLTLPFNPKGKQIFHLIVCSNFEVGIRMTRNAYAKKTDNQHYAPDIDKAFKNFSYLHPETFAKLTGRSRKPNEWKILWRIIKQHEDGICDPLCEDLREIESNPAQIIEVLTWLSKEKYLIPFPAMDAWNSMVGKWRFKLNWQTVQENLGILPPLDLQPISPEQFQAASKLVEEN